MQGPKKIFINENMCTIYKLIFHKIQNILIKSGFELVNDSFDSDLCIAGVCAAFNADEDRSVEIVDNMLEAGKPVYAYGCMTQVSPDKLYSCRQFASWRPDYLIKELTNGDLALWHTEVLPNGFRYKSDYRVYNPKKRFLGISTGCSFECSYCPHKKGAGNIVSIPESEILRQVEMMNTESTETIVLTGTDTACYGVDIGTSFSVLLKNVLRRLRNDIAIHIAQFNPEGLFFNDEHMDLMCDLLGDVRVTDIQLPIQTASQRLLRLMNRNYSLVKLEKFIETLRTRNQALILRTDLMLGFPTETVGEVDESIEYARNNFNEIAIYNFEMKGGTPISYMDLPAINTEEVEKRREYAVGKLMSFGCLVHSGGQRIETLICNDKMKEALRGTI